MLWYTSFGLQEANPILVSSIENSLLRFTLVKLMLSLPGIWLLNKYLDRLIAQRGLAILLVAYFGIYLIHCFVLINIILN
jgi:hypothetical protein